ncbi:protein crumbs-like [Ruditapes philippinarum]|uniref:protein crumbs-like n=1 Tax=Ruditapes philippinarum TaxID=129788 RepID=UPI00295ACD5B|nr:protein crumbs-like [Ruditapes philippinarum]
MQSKLITTSLTICDGVLVNSQPTNQGYNLLGVTSWPVFQVTVQYNEHNITFENQQYPPASYRAGVPYNKAKPLQMTFTFGDKTLVLEAIIWCDTHHSGNYCQHTCSARGNKICDENGHLVCKTGYHGNNCIDINECQGSNPCTNGGTCHNTPGSFTCQCLKSWTGRLCDVDVDECSLQLCTNATTCTNSPGSFHCQCENGFRGRYCTDTDECKLPIKLCQHNGTCLNTYGSYSCICSVDYFGNRCEQCQSCGPHSVNCTNKNGNLTCKCKEGWNGKTCQNDIDECHTKSCHNGTCNNNPGTYSCSCYSGYTGRHCENDLDECLSVRCANNGTCVNLPYPQRYRCDCAPGWDPKSRCHHHLDECKPNPCIHGNCTNKNGNYLCTCKTGWTGRKCDVFDRCKENPCLNNGTCSNEPVNNLCKCANGWTGDNCSVDIDECNTSNPCKNNGRCTNINGGYMCVCGAGWTGQNCTADVNECRKYNPCKHNGSSLDINECEVTVPCQNNGTCKNTNGGYSCTCPFSWKGDNCEISIIDCNNLPCQNNGSCSYTNDGYTCKCSKGWTGRNCESGLSSNFKLEDAIKPECTDFGWNISVDMSELKQLYPGITINNIFFGDNSCKGKLVESIVLFSQGFQDCLTAERISGDTIIYENELFYAIYDPIRPFIIRQHKFTFGVECDVSRNEATSSHVHHNVEMHHSAVLQHYSINMAFYKDQGYIDKLPGNPIQTNVGDDIYVKVFTTATDWNIKMRLHTCYTSPNQPTKKLIYYIIKDGCEVDSNTHIISQSTHETRFVFQDFEYSTDREGLNINCNATFCESKDFSPGCSQSCQPDNTQALIGK